MSVRRRHFLASGGALAAAAAARVPARAAQFEYKLAWDLPASHPISQAANAFADAVKSESGGRLNVTLYPNGQLGSDPALISQLRLGALEMTLMSFTEFESIVPVAGIERLGFAYPDLKTATSAFEGDLGAFIRRELAAKGVLIFERIWAVGMRQMINRAAPIRTAADMQGLKVRVPPGAITTDLFRDLGASPVSISGAEQYTALQTHVVDAAEGPMVNFLSSKMYEIINKISITNHQFTADTFAMNPGAFRALPRDVQEIVQRNANLWGVRGTANTDAANKTAGSDLQKLGATIATADTATFRAKLGGYYAKWYEEFGPSAWALLEKYVGKLSRS